VKQSFQYIQYIVRIDSSNILLKTKLFN